MFRLNFDPVDPHVYIDPRVIEDETGYFPTDDFYDYGGW